METLASPLNYENASLKFGAQVPSSSVTWQSPSNIALVKYWGKRDIQIPCNPSVSFTLKASLTETTVEYAPGSGNTVSVEFYLDKVRNEKFEAKIGAFLESIRPVFPFVAQLHFRIFSHNTFPHSAGIASSASGMSALALCLCSIEKEHFGNLPDDSEFYRKASYIARLGSGSACRSVYGGLVSWGKIEGRPDTSDEFGTQLDPSSVHPDFQDYRDSILIVDSAQKKVSSRVGHGLMNTNPFSEERFRQANRNIVKLIEAIRTGDQETFIKITESEALTLHAMMMTSDPYFLLMRPNTLNIIEKIFAYREQTGHPVCFTLDAGPNIHLLYPQRIENEVKSFINAELVQFLHDFCMIDDQVGNGPNRINL